MNHFDDFVDLTVFGDGGSLGADGGVYYDGEFGCTCGGRGFGGGGRVGGGETAGRSTGRTTVCETGSELTGCTTLVRSTARSVLTLSRTVAISMIETLVFVCSMSITTLECWTVVVGFSTVFGTSGDGEIETLGVV